MIDLEAEPASTLEVYGATEENMATFPVLELMVEDNKDAVDEIVTQFIEKVENELTQKDAAMTKGRLREW